MYQFPWNDFQNERIIVTVNNQEEYRLFLEKCVEQGITWVDGLKIVPTVDCHNYDSKSENCFVCHIGLMSGNVEEIFRQLPLETTQIIAYSLLNF